MPQMRVTHTANHLDSSENATGNAGGIGEDWEVGNFPETKTEEWNGKTCHKLCKL